MYNPETYLTLDLVSTIVSKYEWPAPYTLEDDLPDGVIMRFPKCSLYFSEGFESDMDLNFLPQDTGTDIVLGFTHALLALVPEAERDPNKPLTPVLTGDDSPGASLDKVKNGLRDLCTIALYHLKPCLLGDFSWVATYQATMRNQTG